MQWATDNWLVVHELRFKYRVALVTGRDDFDDGSDDDVTSAVARVKWVPMRERWNIAQQESNLLFNKYIYSFPSINYLIQDYSILKFCNQNDFVIL